MIGFDEIDVELHLTNLEDEVADIYEEMETNLWMEVQVLKRELQNSLNKL